MKEAIVLLADTHINSRMGLCNSDIIDDDGNVYQQNLIQKWLWKNWTDCVKTIKDLTKGHKKTVILNGDIVDLDTYNRSNQMISRNPATILKMAETILKPIIDIKDNLFVIRGTEAHVGSSGWLEEMMAHEFGAIKDPDTMQSSWWHLRAKFGGLKFDISHHVSLGGLPWSFAQGVMRLVQSTRMDYLDWNEEMPDFIIRAHQHRYADSGTTFSTRGVCLPCWQYKPAYLYRTGKENSKPSIGAVVILCNKGQYELIPMLYEPMRSKIWESA